MKCRSLSTAMRQCACALKCGVLARAKYARRSTISRGTAAVGLWGSDCPRPALLNHQPTSLLSSPNTCRPPSTPPAPHLHQESTLDAKELSDALPLWSPPVHPTLPYSTEEFHCHLRHPHTPPPQDTNSDL